MKRALAALCLLSSFAGAAPQQTASPAAEILRASGVTGGLVVIVGAGDGALAVDLARAGTFLVHALDADEADVERARGRIQSQGLYGQVAADRWSPPRLPYVDNLVNLLIVAKPGSVSEKEILRVLAPGGAAHLADGSIRRKPRPAALGEWTHERFGPDRNAVSNDQVVNIPQGIQWMSAEAGSGKSFLSAGGRNFYGNVVARDAFNGLPLWKANAKAKAAIGNRLYAISGASLVALDAATGAVAQRYEEAGSPVDVLYEKGTLVAINARSVRAVEASGGKLLWNRDAAAPEIPLVEGDRVFFVEGNARRGEKRTLVGVDLATGKESWTAEAPPSSDIELSGCAHGGTIVLETSTLANSGQGCGLHAYAMRDGRKLWDHPYVPSMAHKKVARAFFSENLLWIASHEGLQALDPLTGKQVKRHGNYGTGHCFPPVATSNFYIHGELDFTDLQSGNRYYSRIQKGACQIGFYPANGLVYTFPSHCICFPMLKGTNALSSAPDRRMMEVSQYKSGASAPLLLPVATEGNRLETGRQRASVATGIAGPAAPPPAAPSADEWPMYRRDAWRSGSTPSAVPARVERLWESKVAEWPAAACLEEWKANPVTDGPLTAPVVAAGMVFVAVPDAHRVVALDDATGRQAWSFTADGRVDTPPTIHQGRCLFGTASGWVYALSAATGEQLWRFRAAPADERIVAHGQVESLWPVPGSVLVDDGTAFVAAGRHPHADGGIFVYALDPAAGKPRWQQQVQEIGIGRWYARQAMDFEPFDLMVKDGDHVAFSRWGFDPARGVASPEPKSEHYRARRTGVWVPRGLWSYGQPQNRERARRPLMVFDDHWSYAADDVLAARKLQGGGKAPTAKDLGTDDGGDVKKGGPSGEPGAAWTARCGKVKALVLAGRTLFVAEEGGELRAVSASDGKPLDSQALGGAPVWDGLAAAGERLYVSLQSGRVLCLGRR
jgi:outer membrane protein assembly factor BamB